MIKSLLFHGPHEEETLRTLLGTGVKEFGFDLRARSGQLVRLADLPHLLTLVPQEVPQVLIFENDLPATIHSVFDLLKNSARELIVEYRDLLGAHFYQTVGRPFYWYWRSGVDFRSILSLPLARGVILPVARQSEYRDPELWQLVEKNHLRVFLQPRDLTEAAQLALEDDVELSLDLGPELEHSYRQTDQQKLKNLTLWRSLS